MKNDSDFWSNVNKDGPIVREDLGPCWIWTGRTEDGYGRLWHGGKHDRAHRVSWREANGKIPRGMLICHSCDNRPCVRPSHLFVGTIADNNDDMIAKGRSRFGVWQIAKTHCPSGHEYSGDNLLVCSGKRYCRTCNRLKARRRAELSRGVPVA